MNTVLFIAFIMMIIIFINELKNISMSLFKIYYIKDVADINIKKYCNDIYCEAETSRFKLADNSYSLISSNDIFNTKTYYFMILILVILIYVNLFYNLIEYNNIFYPLINNIDGDTIIYIIKFLPYLLAFIIFTFIIIIIIARYIPYDKKGYINYFNYNNPYIDVINNFNIDNIHIYIWATIIAVGGLYILLSIQFAEILQYPDEDYTRGKKYKYLCVGYITIICFFTYLILNLMNILLSFSENNYPKLDDNIIDTILNNLDIKINEISTKYDPRDIVNKCYTNIANIKWNDKDKTTDPQLTIAKLYNIIDIYDSYKGKDSVISNNIKIENYKTLKENTVFLTTQAEYEQYYALITDKPEITISRYDPIKILNNLTIYDLVNGKNTTFVDKIKEFALCSNKPPSGCIINKGNTNILLTILILFSMNEIKKFKKEILELTDVTNKVKNNYYIKHLKLLEFVNYINTLIIDPRNLKLEKINKLDENMKKYIEFNVNIGATTNDEHFFGTEHDPFSTKNEANENYSADFSYNSENTFYEKYFNVLENLKNKGYYDLEYNVGSYYIKNIKTLIYFILIIFAIGILCILLLYIPNTELIYKYAEEIILPIVLLLIFVLYIAIFINFNTNYNSNVIYGVLDSSYKRDLNDLNNMLIPVINKSKSDEKYNTLEKGNYLELYIISNVFMSLIYNSNDNIGDYSVTLKDKSNEEIDNRIDYGEKLDHINFKKDYEYLGKIIYDKLYNNDELKTGTDENLYNFLNKYSTDTTNSSNPNIYATAFLKSDGTSLHLKNYIDKFIMPPTGDKYEYQTDQKKYTPNDLRKFLIIVIKNLIKYFKKYDIKKKIINDEDNENFFKNNVIFYKKDNKVIWNKFILKKSFFDEYKVGSLLSGKYNKIFKDDLFEDELIIVDKYVDQYLKILSHYYFNCIIKKETDVTIQNIIRTALNDKEKNIQETGLPGLKKHIDNYRNNKLIKLLLFIKPTTISQTIDIDMDDTFKIKSKTIEEENKLINDAIDLFSNSNNNIIKENLKPLNLSNMYQYMIKNSLRKNQDDSTNYLMNIIKTIYYEINNEKIQYHNDYISDESLKPAKLIIKQLETDSGEKIYENARYTISYELFNTYFLNLIMIVFIYNIALLKK
jgi:hypothetical protein